MVRSAQKALDDLLFRFLLGEAERHELDDLLARDLADGCLVDELGVHAVGRELGYRRHAGAVHDDGIALRMAVARRVAVDARAERLAGIVRRHRTGHDVGARPLAVEIDDKVGARKLPAVRIDLLTHDELGARL